MALRQGSSKIAVHFFAAPSLISRINGRLFHASVCQAAQYQQPVPPPTPFVPDHTTFLTLIGRELSQHASKIPSWEALFSLSSGQLRELGVEPARARRYLIWWRERFRHGMYGVGGDLLHVKDGEAEVRSVERHGHKVVVNVDMAADQGTEDKLAQRTLVRGVKPRWNGAISGSHFFPIKGSRGTVARIKVAEGLWEVKRGRKIHGGERRRKNVLSRIAAKARGTLK